MGDAKLFEMKCQTSLYFVRLTSGDIVSPCFIKQVFILHSKQQKYIDLVYRFLFNVFWLSISAIIR